MSRKFKGVDWFLVTSFLFLLSYKMIRLTNAVSNEVNVTSQPQTPSFDIWGAVTLVKDGSYAIVLFLIIVIWVTRNTASKFLEKHLELMGSLKESNDSHLDNAEKLGKSLERISNNNTVLTKVLAKHFNIDLKNIDED